MDEKKEPHYEVVNQKNQIAPFSPFKFQYSFTNQAWKETISQT